MIRIFIISIFLLLSGCSSLPENTGAVIHKDTMAAVLRDILLAEGYVESYLIQDTSLKKDTLLKQEIDLVLKLHNLDANSFSTSYRYYKNHPDLFKLVIDSASVRFSKEKEKVLDKLIHVAP